LQQVEEERATILEQTRRESAAELERFRAELAALRQRVATAGMAPEAVRDVEAAAEELAEAVAEPVTVEAPVAPVVEAPPRRPIHRGDRVWVQPLNAEGEVLTVEGPEAEVQVGPARLRVAIGRLELRAAPPGEVEPSRLAYDVPHADVRLDLRGCVVEEALERLDRHLDAASLAGLPWVQIVHGKGTGALRQAVRDFLRTHPLVSSCRAGDEGEGGEGITVANLVQG